MPDPIYANLTHCPHCTMRFLNAAGIEQHIAERHPQAVAPPEPVYAPPHVPGKHRDEAAAVLVKAVSIAQELLTCNRCGLVAKNSAGLKAHIRIKHATKPEAPPAA